VGPKREAWLLKTLIGQGYFGVNGWIGKTDICSSPRKLQLSQQICHIFNPNNKYDVIQLKRALCEHGNELCGSIKAGNFVLRGISNSVPNRGF